MTAAAAIPPPPFWYAVARRGRLAVAVAASTAPRTRTTTSTTTTTAAQTGWSWTGRTTLRDSYVVSGIAVFDLFLFWCFLQLVLAASQGIHYVTRMNTPPIKFHTILVQKICMLEVYTAPLPNIQILVPCNVTIEAKNVLKPAANVRSYQVNPRAKTQTL